MNNQKIFMQKKLYFIFFLLFFSLHIHAIEATSGKITVSFSKLPLSEAIKKIETVSDYSFFYDVNKTNLQQQVSLQAEDLAIETAMKLLLKGTNLTFSITNRQIALIPKPGTETAPVKIRTLTGVVVDENEEPVIGANVVEKGTTNGVITDIDGKFSLSIPDNTTLKISYIGYLSREIVITDQEDVHIVMTEDFQALEEVVVVGYGIQKKVNVIGSIAQIGTKELANRSTPQLSNALTGQMPGVTVIQRSGKPGDSGGEIRVRGVGSFGATPSALILIDGIPGSLNNINMEDVESISVLKDASSAAIYGARAANGVILVTTKAGKEGKISVAYNGYVGFNDATTLPKFVNSWEWGTLYNRAIGREEYTQDVIQKLKDGSDPDRYANESYLDRVLGNKGFQTGHNVTLNGGNTANQYMLSFGYLTQDGIVDKNNYSRYNARVNITNELSPQLKLTTRLSGVYAERKEPNVPGGDDATGMTGIIQKAIRFPGLYPTVLSDGTFGAGPEQHGTPVSWIMSPSFWKNPQFSVAANIRLDYNPIKDLTIAAVGAYEYSNNETRAFKSTHKLTGGRELGPSWLNNIMSKTIYKSFQATANYQKSVSDHNFTVLAGYSWEEQNFNELSASRDNFPGNSLHQLNAGSPDNQKNTGTGNQWAIQSLFGRLTYNYAERYLLESTVRYDGSSRFPKDNKYAFFPSVGLGWRVSEESFIRESESFQWLSNFKLKASWGRLGNQNIGNYPYQTMFVLGQNYPFGDKFNQGAAITTATDPTIKWEETETIDGGVESIFFNGLLSANVTYFYRKTYDILYAPSGSVSSVLGQKVSVTNTGELKNTGWEFELGHRNQIGDFSYNLNANLSIINNEVISLGVGNVEQPNGLVGNGSNLFIGYPMQLYYGYLSDGVFLDQSDIDTWVNQSKVTPKPQPGDIRYKDISGPDGVPDGVVDAQYDRVYLGTRIPKYTFGLNIGAGYKGIDLSVLLQGVSGVKGLLDNYAGLAFRSNNGNVQRWQADGAFDPENPTRYPKYPRLEILSNANSPNIETSDFWILNASYIRLKNIQLGYTLPRKILNKMHFENLRVYVQAENPLTWNKYPEGWDPEINTGGDYYPILRTFTFGINLKF